MDYKINKHNINSTNSWYENNTMTYKNIILEQYNDNNNTMTYKNIILEQYNDNNNTKTYSNTILTYNKNIYPISNYIK